MKSMTYSMTRERGKTMKRDQAWLTNEIEIMGSETSENYPHEQMVGREVVLNLIDQLDESEKVVVPQWFDEWVKGNIFHSQYHGKMLMIKNISQVGWSHTFETGMSGEVYKPDSVGNLSIYHTEVYNDQEKYIRAVLDGYEIEKEKLYRVEMPGTDDLMLTLEGNEYYFDEPLDYVGERPDIRQEFTESEIKAIDERYWMFKKEVTQ